MAYRSSPLNPHARKVGYRPTDKELERTITDARRKAGESDSGYVYVEVSPGIRITVRDTDVIKATVEQVKKDLGLI